jgi:hypothetical protein
MDVVIVSFTSSSLLQTIEQKRYVLRLRLSRIVA